MIYLHPRSHALQGALFPVEIIQQFPATGSTADLKLVGIGNDSYQYAIKTLADSPRLPISEWVGHQLCRSLGIATPDYAVVKLFDGSYAFGSRWDFLATQIPKVPSLLDFSQYFSEIKKEVAEIYAVDMFLPNEDRHARNLLFRQGVAGLVPLAFDFSRAWIMLGLPFGTQLTMNCNTCAWWTYLKTQFGFSPANHIFEAIENLPDSWLEDVLNTAPSSWVSTFDTSESIRFWKDSRVQRCRLSESML